jgi:hypothetical protein
MPLKNSRAVFLSLARDCARFLPDVLRNIRLISDLFGKAAFVFIENDSYDSTKAILEDWSAKAESAKIISLDGLALQIPPRTVRLAHIRNFGIAFIKDAFADFDYVFILDADDSNRNPIDIQAVGKALQFLGSNENYAGVFANQFGTYYDMWALRHPLLCPNDIWEEVADFVISNNATDQFAFDKMFRPKILNIGTDHDAIGVESAFGGLGIYKMSSILANKSQYVGQRLKNIQFGVNDIRHSGFQTCEHVTFNKGFIANGEQLFILPYLINGIRPDIAFPVSAWRGMFFDIRRNQLCPCNSGKKYKHCHGTLIGR